MAPRDLAEAADCFRRGQIADALMWLERAIPEGFPDAARRVERYFSLEAVAMRATAAANASRTWPAFSTLTERPDA